MRAARRGSVEREHAARILVWFLGAGVFWVAGGIVEGAPRAWLWIAALVLAIARQFEVAALQPPGYWPRWAMIGGILSAQISR